MSKRWKHRKKSKALETGTGIPCPKCKKAMGRFGHPSAWRPKKHQPFFYQWWDKCAQCGHLQHYKDAMVWHGNYAAYFKEEPPKDLYETDPLTAQFKATIG